MTFRYGLDPNEEKKSYSALFVLLVALLIVGAIWSIWDDNISRRPWKEYQVEFYRRAYDQYMKQAQDEQNKLNKNPEYVKLNQQLEQAEKELRSGEVQNQLDKLHGELEQAKHVTDDKDQAVRFTKSELTERWYDYNHAIQTEQDAAPIKAQIDKLMQQVAAEQGDADQAKHNQLAIQGKIEALNSKVETIDDKLKTLSKNRDDLIDKADTYFKRIPSREAAQTKIRRRRPQR